MSSKQAQEMGLIRKGDGYEQDPKHFTILDVDIGRAELIKRYEGKPTEIAIIEGIRQDRRQKALGDPAFVESCESGVTEDIQFIRLRPDNQGKSWLIVDKGNNRCFALRIVNEQRKLAGMPPFLIPAKQAARPGSGDAAGKYAAERHHLSNVRAKMLPSHKAEAAASLRGNGLAPHSIVRYIDGVDTEAEILDLLALDKCVEEVKDAADSGAIKVSAAIKLAEMNEDEQRAWLAKRTAPKERKPREKTGRPLTPKKIERFAEHLASDHPSRELVGILQGKIDPLKSEHWRAAWLRAFPEAK